MTVHGRRIAEWSSTEVDDNGQPLDIGLPARACRWPIGPEPLEARLQLFCGRPVIDKKVYCPACERDRLKREAPSWRK